MSTTSSQPPVNEIIQHIETILNRRAEDNPESDVLFPVRGDLGLEFGCNQYLVVTETIPDRGGYRELSVTMAGTGDECTAFLARQVDGAPAPEVHLYEDGPWIAELQREALGTIGGQ